MLLKSQKGFSLIEVIISIALIGIVGVGILSGLGVASKALHTTDVLETAKNLAEMQIEYIKSLPYAAAYAPAEIETEYPGFSILTNEHGKIQAKSIPGRTDGNIQKIEVTVRHASKDIITIAGYKLRR